MRIVVVLVFRLDHPTAGTPVVREVGSCFGVQARMGRTDRVRGNFCGGAMRLCCATASCNLCSRHGTRTQDKHKRLSGTAACVLCSTALRVYLTACNPPWARGF